MRWQNPAKSAVARKVLTACWHILNPNNLQTGPLPGERHRRLGELQLLSGGLTAAWN